MSIVSHELAMSRTGVMHTYWRENVDGTRDALYKVMVPEGHSVILSSPDGTLERMMAEVAYEFETDLDRETPGYDVLPADPGTRKRKRRWRKK